MFTLMTRGGDAKAFASAAAHAIAEHRDGYDPRISSQMRAWYQELSRINYEMRDDR